MGAHRSVITVIAAALLASACSTQMSEKDLAEGRFIGDLDARGVPTGPTNGAPPELGQAVCTDLKDGARADAKVLQIANLQQNHQPQFTVPQAEIVVYWAVTELCPTFSSQLQPGWADGG